MGSRTLFRTLRRSPGYAGAFIGTLALSTSLAATVFAIVDGVLFKPLPYPDADRLFRVMGSAGPGDGSALLSATDVRYLNEAGSGLRVTGYAAAASLTHPDRPDLVIRSAEVDFGFFQVLGQYPLVGGFRLHHHIFSLRSDRARPAIISYNTWQQWLAGETQVVGRTVELVGTRLEIVGVLPRDFLFPAVGAGQPDVVFPRSAPVSQDRWTRTLHAVARFPAGMTADEAVSRFSAVLTARVNEYSPREARPGPYVSVSIQSLDQYLRAAERPVFQLALIGAALLVVLGSLNVAGLFAARVRDRERELTIRVAVGAGRPALAALLVLEALSLALLGGLLGVVVSGPVLAVTLPLLPDSIQLMKPPVIDWRVTLFVVIASVVTVGIAALGPAAFMARKVSLRAVFGTTITHRGNSWTQGTLLAVQGALGIVLVIAGSLVVGSFILLRGEDPGFQTKGLAVLEIRTPGASSRSEVTALHARVADRIRQLRGITGVATVGVPLLQNRSGGSQFAFPAGARPFFANDVPVSGDFFDVAGLTLLDGRVFSGSEIQTGRPVAVVSELTAREYWPGRRAVGQTLANDERTVTVVGVVEEARFAAQDELREGEIYIPLPLATHHVPAYLLKTTQDPSTLVREAALAVGTDIPGAHIQRAESFDAALKGSVRVQRFRAFLFGVFASAGLLVLAAGISGLVATGVARRVREIGIRGALGAQRRQLVTLVMMDHLRPSLIGAALGLVVSWWTTRLLSALLYQIDARDPRVWLAASAGFFVVALVAAWIPARRASSVDPLRVLKAE